MNVGLQRQYTGLVKELQTKDAAKRSRQKRKLTLLEEELKTVNEKNWQSIIEKKVKHMEIVETRFQEYRKQGLMKQWKSTRKVSEQRNPKVAKNYKYQRRISIDLESLRAGNFEYYERQLIERIVRCRKKIEEADALAPSMDFQLDTMPLVLSLTNKPTNSTLQPWCLTAPQPDSVLLALPSNSPPFHLLDGPTRVYLKNEPATPAVNAAASGLPKPFSFSTPKKTTNSAVALLKTDDLSLQVQHLRHLVPSMPADHCKVCRRATEWIKDEKDGFAICSTCNFARSIAFSCKESAYGTDIEFIEPFHYEKRGHFIACLRQRQAKQDANLPVSVLVSVRAEILRIQMTDPLLLRPKHIRKILKRLGLSNYYDDDVLIWSMITGTKPPRFTDAQEAKLIGMFDESLKSYLKHKGERNNYLTYSFAIHKMIEILDWDREIREFYPVLKSDSKRDAQEIIFHNMCREMGWPIIRTQQQFINEAKFSF
jgi:hypothetical protein